jgi:hypothetical protein
MLAKKLQTLSPQCKNPEEYVNYGRDIPNLHLGNTTPEHVIEII